MNTSLVANSANANIFQFTVYKSLTKCTVSQTLVSVRVYM